MGVVTDVEGEALPEGEEGVSENPKSGSERRWIPSLSQFSRVGYEGIPEFSSKIFFGMLLKVEVAENFPHIPTTGFRISVESGFFFFFGVF